VRGHILVVDDDCDLRDTLEVILDFHQYRVTTAESGNAALAFLRTHDLPDLILLDLVMPGLSGDEFREQQLRDPELASIPVIVMSGAADEPVGNPVVPALRKPVELDELLAVVARYV
jgi:CheY-like chemotaxis protein